MQTKAVLMLAVVVLVGGAAARAVTGAVELMGMGLGKGPGAMAVRTDGRTTCVVAGTHAGLNVSGTLRAGGGGAEKGAEKGAENGAGAFASVELARGVRVGARAHALVVHVARGDGRAYAAQLQLQAAAESEAGAGVEAEAEAEAEAKEEAEEEGPVFRFVFRTRGGGQPSAHVLPLGRLPRNAPLVLSLACVSQHGPFHIVVRSVLLDSEPRALQLFGPRAPARWRPSSWTPLSDSVHRGRSSAEFDILPGHILRFHGSLVPRSVSSILPPGSSNSSNSLTPTPPRAFASIVSDRRHASLVSASAPFYDLGAWSAISIAIARGDGKKYSLNLHPISSPPAEYALEFETVDGLPSVHTLSLRDLIVTRAGALVEKSDQDFVDFSTVRAISLKCASMGGIQKGPFDLHVESISVLSGPESYEENTNNDSELVSDLRDEL